MGHRQQMTNITYQDQISWDLHGLRSDFSHPFLMSEPIWDQNQINTIHKIAATKLFPDSGSVYLQVTYSYSEQKIDVQTILFLFGNLNVHSHILMHESSCEDICYLYLTLTTIP